DQPDMNDIFQPGGDDVGSPPDQNHIAYVRQAQDRFRGLPNQQPGAGVQPEQFVDGVLNLRDPALGHEPRQAWGQVMILQNLFHQVPVEHRPGRLGLRRSRLQQSRQRLRYRQRPATGLPRNRYRPPLNLRNDPVGPVSKLDLNETQKPIIPRLRFHKSPAFVYTGTGLVMALPSQPALIDSLTTTDDGGSSASCVIPASRTGNSASCAPHTCMNTLRATVSWAPVKSI